MESTPRARTPAGPARKPKKKRPPSPLPPSPSPVPGPSSLQEFRPVPRPYLARAPSPISNTPHNRLAEMVLPSSFTRPQEGPSAQILGGAAVGSGGSGRERGQKKKKASRYAQGLLAPPSIVPGGVPAAPRVQHQQLRDRRRGEDRLGRHAGGTASQTRLQDLPTGNPSQTSLGHLATILGSDPVAAEQDPAPARRRRRIVRGEEEEGLRRRVTVSSREEGRALGVARGASMRRRNVWDEIPDQMTQESGEPPPPFPFPNAATARLPPAFARSPLSQEDAGSQADGGEGGRARSPPPTWEQAVGLTPSPAPAPAPGTGATSEDQPAPPTLVIPPTASRRSHRGSSTERSASPASTRYESAPSSPFLAPTPNLTIPSLSVNPPRGPSPAPTGRSQSGISPIIEQDENAGSDGADGGDGMTKQEREDRRMWNADLLAGYTLEERVKREWGRKLGREGGVGEGQGGEEVEAEQPQFPVAEGPAIEEPPVASDEQETVAPVEEDAGEVISPAVEPPNPSPPPPSHTPPPSTPTEPRPQTPPPAPVQPDPAPAPIPSPKKLKKSKKKGKEWANTAQERKRMTSTEMGEKSPVAASSPRTPWSTEAPAYKKEVREEEEVEEAPSRVYGPPKGTLVPREEEVTAIRPKDEGKPSEKAGRKEPETLRPLVQKTAWASSPEINQIPTPAHVRSKSSGNVLGGARASVSQAEAAARKPEDELTVGRRKSEGNLAGSGKKDENARMGDLPPSREAALRRRDLAVPKPTPTVVAPVPASPPKPPIAKVEKLRYGVSGPLINLDDSDPAPSSSASSIRAPQKYMRDDERGDSDKADVQKKRESNQSLWRLAASSVDLLQLLESGGDRDEPSTSSKPGPEDTSEAVSITAPVASSSKIPPPVPPSLASRRKIPPPIPPRPHYVVNQPPPLPPRKSDNPPPVPPLPAPKRRPPPPPPPRHPVAVAQLGLQDEESKAERDEEAGSEGIPQKDTAAPREEPPVSAAPASVSSKRPLGPRPPPPPRLLRLRSPWAREQASPSLVLSEPAPAPDSPDKREETTEPLEGPRSPPQVRRINAAPAPGPVLWLTPLPTPTPLSDPTAGNMTAPRLTLRPLSGRTQSDVHHPHYAHLPSQSAPHPTPSEAQLGLLHQGGSGAEAEEADDTRVNRSASAVDLRDGDGVEQAGVGVDVTHGENGGEDGLGRLPSAQDGPGPGVHSRPGPSVIREEREGSAGREYTDLELFVARLDGSGREYEGFSHLTTFLGPSKPAAASPAALATLLPGMVSVDSRRTTPQGKVKLKLSLLGVRVAKCPICLSQFKGGDKGVLVPGCGHAGHESCVRRWFREDGRCFVCREVLKEE
ncbi:hypothetical protein L198_03217 [Cryptococcus wingfieldii CBS 7118]|uniref:RING-type domain-containing protein n=1 Tax=Cryptococcus wingfieldii CBS 7118 TaxID=1295528 RepID=A0A1E3JFB8_9TREE|nr:hypothetical protein L198_03217 [Cryptococcus wingfieldii CBS 7118]ODN99375.1 hypothetical protein L198_03217 [Cryptococcus wingfieldii CBS 7118]